MLDVLHDISDGVRALSEQLGRIPSATVTQAEDGDVKLLSVDALAESLGVTPRVVYSMRQSGSGPPATRLGSRLYFQRSDVIDWLQGQREDRTVSTRPWRESFVPGRIGASLPRSSVPTKREYCTGSHSEPMAASTWSGRAVCRVCRDDVLVNKNGRLRKHYPRWW